MLRRHCVAICTVSLLAVGCADQTSRSTPWEFDDDTGASDVADTGGVDTRPDTASDTGRDTSDTLDTSDIGRDTDVECSGPEDWEVEYVRQPARAMGSPVLTDGAIYVTRQTDGMNTGLAAIDPAGSRERLSIPGGFQRIVAAADGNVLLVGGGRNERFGLVVDSGGDTNRVQFDRPIKRSLGIQPGGTGRVFDGKRAAMVLENDPNQAPGWVGYYESGPRTIHVEDWSQAPAALTDRGFAVLARTGPLSGGGNIEVNHWNADSESLERLTSTDADESSLASDGERLWWTDDRGVVTWEVESGTKTRVHSGNCGDIHARDGRAVFVCAGDTGTETSGPASMLGGEVWLWQDGRLHQISGVGDYNYHPRLGTKGLVWVEYDSETAFDAGSGAGMIYWASVDGREPMRVDEVGAPCLTCGSIFPDLKLAAEDGLIAWNYATGEGQDPPGPPATTAGYARPIGSCSE